jgi:ABC-type transporter Mla subunit MlaD
MDFLNNLFTGLPTLSLGLIGLITLMTLWFAGPGYNSQSASHSPTILTSTGIFGTFLGVALGLLAFDTKDIQASVPELIEGLKTAFWTSIAGLLGSLIVKFRHLTAVLRQRQVEEQYRSATVTDLANLLGDIRDSISNSEAKGLRSAMETMQAQQLNKFDDMQQSLKNYQTDMVEANTRAFIAAIEQVMRDFNTQINTQYGQNFKELNQAVGQMLEWQENYKKELEELLAAQRHNGDLLDKASTAYQQMVEHSEVFNQVSQSLGKMMDVLQQQASGMDQYIEQLARAATQASEGLPSLEKRVHSLTADLAKGVQESQSEISKTLENCATALRTTSENVNRSLAESMNFQQKELRQRVEQMLDRTEQQVMRLDDAMEEELTKALQTFGYQLTSLSEKFVSDYAPLTERLKELVAMAEAVEQD